MSMLLCFEAAARLGSFTRAAEELSLTNSAVSRSIQSLEDFLGVALFVRQRQRVTLNENGQAYIAAVSGLLERLEVETALTIARAQRDPALKLATYPTFGSRWLIPRLPDFARRHPNVVLNFVTGVTPFNVHSGEIDIAIQHGNGIWANTHAVKLCDERLIAVMAASGHSSADDTPARIAGRLLLSLRTRPTDWNTWHAAQGLSMPEGHRGPVFETFGMLIGAARAGLGVALVPDLYVEDELSSNGGIVALGNSILSGSAFYAICDATRREEPNLARFMSWIASSPGT